MTPNGVTKSHSWWQWGIVYQVYPRSFMDSDGDGVGDLAGITSKLDYLRWLGVNAVWISPIFPSPMKDFGYDVSDYCDIHPLFGSLADFDRLLEEAHRRDLRVLLDLVPNHTSDQHPWFLESRASRDNPKRDWYIWKNAKPDGGPPNNWLANFGGIGWMWDEHTQQYYYHAFLAEQPDLNWRNPELRAAMMDALRFWLDRGVDGFRVDVMYHLIKDEQFRDNPPNPQHKPGDHPYRAFIPAYSCDQPEIHDVVAEMRRTLDEYDDRVMIGEIYLPIERLVQYYGADGAGCHLPFNFQLLLKPWDARIIAATIDRYEGALPEHGWPNWVLGNHDRPRVASRIGPGQARVAAVLLLTLRGTPTVYYGEELGMHDVPVPPEMVQDPPGKTLGFGRDPERTPMQWDAGPNAGFTKGAPWLPLAGDYRAVNAAAQREEPASMLGLYRQLIALRQSEAALMVGRYQPVPADGDIVAYLREEGHRRFLVVLNFGCNPRAFTVPDGGRGEIALSTHMDRAGERVHGAVQFRADEALVIALT